MDYLVVGLFLCSFCEGNTRDQYSKSPWCYSKWLCSGLYHGFSKASGVFRLFGIGFGYGFQGFLVGSLCKSNRADHLANFVIAILFGHGFSYPKTIGLIEVESIPLEFRLQRWRVNKLDLWYLDFWIYDFWRIVHFEKQQPTNWQLITKKMIQLKT